MNMVLFFIPTGLENWYNFDMDEQPQTPNISLNNTLSQINVPLQKSKIKIYITTIFGIVFLSFIGTLIWYYSQKINISIEVVIDKNEDNIADNNEPRLQNIAVNIVSSDTNTKTINKTGSLVVFDDLPKFWFKNYIIPQKIKYDINIASQDNCVELSNYFLNIEPAKKLNEIQILAASSCVSGIVYMDNNADGNKDIEEVGAIFKNVILKGVENKESEYKYQTDETGKYIFKNIRRYIGYYPYTKLIHYQFTTSEDCYRPSGIKNPFTTNNELVDVGLAYSCLKGTVYHDKYADGRFNGQDVVISGGKVNLYLPGETKISTSTNINSDGKFIFKNLENSRYLVDIEKKYFKTVNPPEIVSLSNSLSLAIGVYCSCVSGWVFLDSNENEKFDKTESGLSGFRVTVVDSNAPKGIKLNGTKYMWENTSDDSGYYVISNLPYNKSNFYSVLLAPKTEYDDVNKRRNHQVTIPPDIIFNFPMKARVDAVTLKTTIYEDKNGNNKKDSNEPGIPNVNVGLFNGSGVSGLSKPDGSSTFPSNDPGYYTVIVRVPDYYSYDGILDGPFVNKIINLKDSNSYLNIGLIKSGGKYSEPDVNTSYSVSGSVFDDKNGNGVKDFGENPIINIPVSVIKLNAQSLLPSSMLTFMNTDGKGEYTILNPQPQFEESTLPGGYYSIGWYDNNNEYLPTTPKNIYFVLDRNRIINFGLQRIK